MPCHKHIFSLVLMEHPILSGFLYSTQCIVVIKSKLVLFAPIHLFIHPPTLRVIGEGRLHRLWFIHWRSTGRYKLPLQIAVNMKCVNLFCPGAHTDHGGRPAKEIPTAGGLSGLWDCARASMEGTLPLVWGQPQPAPTGMYAISHQRCHPGHLICASVNVICLDFFLLWHTIFPNDMTWHEVSHELVRYY